MDLTVPEALKREDGGMTRPLPPVPDLHDVVSPEVLTELMLAILNRGDRR